MRGCIEIMRDVSVCSTLLMLIYWSKTKMR